MGIDKRLMPILRVTARQMEVRKKWRKLRAGKIRIGYTFAIPSEFDQLWRKGKEDLVCLRTWCVVRRHPDDPKLLFMVPVDDVDLYQGCCDVKVCSAEVLRCGYGIWFDADDLEPSMLFDKVPLTKVIEAQKVLAWMVRGTGLEPTEDQIADESDAEYEEICGDTELHAEMLKRKYRERR
jgi:hypothetical protein